MDSGHSLSSLPCDGKWGKLRGECTQLCHRAEPCGGAVVRPMLQRAPLEGAELSGEKLKPELYSAQLRGPIMQKNQNKNKTTSLQLRYFPWHISKNVLRQQSAPLSWSRALAPRSCPLPEHTWGRTGRRGGAALSGARPAPRKSPGSSQREQRARPINTGFGGRLSYYSRQRALFGCRGGGVRGFRLTGPALLPGALPLSL